MISATVDPVNNKLQAEWHLPAKIEELDEGTYILLRNQVSTSWESGEFLRRLVDFTDEIVARLQRSAIKLVNR
jgi:hypothetical protein